MFPDKIRNFFVDTATHLLTVQLNGRKNVGEILQYDLNTKKVLWTKKIYYDTDELLKFDKLLIFNEYNEAYVLDNYTGENLSKILNYIYIANPEYNIGFAYLYVCSACLAAW